MVLCQRRAGQRHIHKAIRITKSHLPNNAVRKAQLAVCARTNPQVVAKLPVIAVVKALMAGLGIGRDLIATHTRRNGAGRNQVQHFVSRIVLRNHRRVLGEVGIGLNGQVINRQMRRRKRERHIHIALQIRLGLAGQRIHQVDIEGLEIVRRLAHSRLRLRGIMHTAHRLQKAVIKALYANRQAVHTRRTESLEAVFLKRAGVGFHGDFAVRLHAQTGTQTGDQLIDGLRRKQTGRAAAHEDTVYRAPPDQRQRAFQVGHQGIDIAIFRQRIALAPAM